MHASRHAEAIDAFHKVLRLNPINPPSMRLSNLANSYRLMGEYSEAIDMCKKLLQAQPDHFIGNLRLTATYSEMGRMEDARAQAMEVLRINPQITL